MYAEQELNSSIFHRPQRMTEPPHKYVIPSRPRLAPRLLFPCEGRHKELHVKNLSARFIAAFFAVDLHLTNEPPRPRHRDLSREFRPERKKFPN